MRCKKIIKLFFVAVFFLPLVTAFSAPKTDNRLTLQRTIQQAINSKPNANYGIFIKNMTNGKILYQKNINHYFAPASVDKLFPAIATLTYMGPDFQFNTWLLTSAQRIVNHQLLGNLYIKFTGDPEFTGEELSFLIGQLKKQGINKIKGHVYVSDSDYGIVPYAPGWMWDDLSYAYAAPIYAAIVDDNKFSLKITPAKKLGQPALLKAKIPLGIVQIKNELTTTKYAPRSCPIAIYHFGNNHYLIKGCLKFGLPPQHRLLALTNPISYARKLVALDLKKNKIKYKGRASIRRAGTNLQYLAYYSSLPLRNIVENMLKKSDNLSADSLLKKMGQLYYNKQGTWRNGIKAMKLILTPSTKINFKNNLIVDGAGLSRYDLVTPKQMGQLLSYAYGNFAIAPELMASLPIAGEDGTLKYRMRNLTTRQHVRGKTGSMAGVSTLAGYLITKNKQTIAYVILINNFIGRLRPYRKIEDKICHYLVTHRA